MPACGWLQSSPASVTCPSPCLHEPCVESSLQVSTRLTNMPCERWFKARLLSLPPSSLLTQLGKQWRTAQGLGPLHPVGDTEEASGSWLHTVPASAAAVTGEGPGPELCLLGTKAAPPPPPPPSSLTKVLTPSTQERPTAAERAGSGRWAWASQPPLPVPTRSSSRPLGGPRRVGAHHAAPCRHTVLNKS